MEVEGRRQFLGENWLQRPGKGRSGFASERLFIEFPFAPPLTLGAHVNLGFVFVVVFPRIAN